MKNTTSNQQKKSSFFKTTLNNLKQINLFSSIRKFFHTADAWGVFVMGSTFVLMLGSAYLVYILQGDFEQFNMERMENSLGLTFMIIAAALFVFKTSFFLYTVYRYFKYKPISSV